MSQIVVAVRVIRSVVGTGWLVVMIAAPQDLFVCEGTMAAAGKHGRVNQTLRKSFFSFFKTSDVAIFYSGRAAMAWCDEDTMPSLRERVKVRASRERRVGVLTVRCTSPTELVPTSERRPAGG